MITIMETLITDIKKAPSQLDQKSAKDAGASEFAATLDEVVGQGTTNRETPLAPTRTSHVAQTPSSTGMAPRAVESDNVLGGSNHQDSSREVQDTQSMETEEAESELSESPDSTETPSEVGISPEERVMLSMVEVGNKLSDSQAVTPFQPLAMAQEYTAELSAIVPRGALDGSFERLNLSTTNLSALTSNPYQLTGLLSSDQPQSDRPLQPIAPALSALSGAAEATAGRGNSPTSTLELSTKEPQNFASTMATHLRVIKNQGGGEAKVNLHPAELGRMSVSVITEGSETKVAFTVETPQARQAIEASLTRLREMLEQAGLSLSDSDVSEQNQHTPSDSRSSDARPKDTGLVETGDVSDSALTLSVTLDPSRLVDIFA